MEKTVTERTNDMLDDIKDGKRFTRSIPKITKDKQKLKYATSLARQAEKVAIETGVKTVEEAIEGKRTIKSKRDEAEMALEKSTGKKITSFNRLDSDDIDFINQLPDDGAKEYTINELFGGRVLASWKTEFPDTQNKGTGLQSTSKSRKFVELYIDNYQRILSGKSYKTQNQLVALSGYGVTVQPGHVKMVPWVALKLDNYHKSVKHEIEYQAAKSSNVQAFAHSMLNELTLDALISAKANKERFNNVSYRDQSTFLKNLHEITNAGNEERGPTVAIQVNSDMASVAISQDKKKQEHLDNSFN